MNGLPDVRFYDHHPGTASLRDEVLAGLARRPKRIPPKFFYDQRGSRLFDVICTLPEYYTTRTEIAILQARAREIAELAGPETLVIELGSGASKKVRLLLDALQPAGYMGIDISKEFLLDSTRRLAADYPWLDVHAACADFSQSLHLNYCPVELNKLAFFPGSSIGNFEPEETVRFLRRLKDALKPRGALLIGVDLKKDPNRLHAAYNDNQGITAAFNLNLLERIRNELDTDLDPRRFDHRAFYNPSAGRIEMHLASRVDQRIRVENRSFHFTPEETIHTENSYKYTIEEFHGLARQTGYTVTRVWTDDQRLFSVHYLEITADDG